MKHHVTGNVTAIDPDTTTFTVTEDKSQKTFTFAAKDRAMFSDVKKGDHVRVAYTKHGAQLTAESVAAKAPSGAVSRRSPLTSTSQFRLGVVKQAASIAPRACA